ncbi:MAG: hypothetical protein ACJ8AO_10340 [Gemmatimonadaceae bacterium]
MKIATGLLPLLLVLPSVTPGAAAAQQPGAAQRSPGAQRAARMGCVLGDTTRSFRRALGDTAGAPAGTRPITGGTPRSRQYAEYDVVLDVPNVCVERIFLKVDSLTAKLNLDARVANLLRVNAGADVLVGNVDLTIQGVRAQALLLVDLDDVVHIVDQTLTFIDNNPQVVSQLAGTVANTGAAVGGLVGGVVRGLLGVTRNAAGQTVQRILNEATGDILERTLSTAGQQVAQRVVGRVTDLRTIAETRNQAGQLVRQVRDQAGALIEYTLERAGGRVLGARILQAAAGALPR